MHRKLCVLSGVLRQRPVLRELQVQLVHRWVLLRCVEDHLPGGVRRVLLTTAVATASAAALGVPVTAALSLTVAAAVDAATLGFAVAATVRVAVAAALRRAVAATAEPTALPAADAAAVAAAVAAATEPAAVAAASVAERGDRRSALGCQNALGGAN